MMSARIESPVSNNESAVVQLMSPAASASARWQISTAQPPADWWPQWDAFNERFHGSHPLLSSTMLKPLVDLYGDSSLSYAAYWRGSRHAALAVVAPAGRNRWAIFTPSQAPLSMLLTDRSVSFEEVAHSLLRALPGYGLSIDVPARDPQLRNEDERPCWLVQSVPLGTTIAVRDEAGFAAYWESRSKDLRKNLRRYFNRATQAGLHWELRRTCSGLEIGDAVDRYGVLESSGWKGKDGTALHPANAQGKAYREIMGAFAELNSGCVYELHLGDRLAASRLVVEGPSMRVILKTTYSEELKQYAPGRLLLHLVLNHALDASRKSVEFYTRANDDLRSWATSRRELFATTVYRNSLVVLAALLRRRIQDALARPREPAETSTSISSSNFAS